MENISQPNKSRCELIFCSICQDEFEGSAHVTPKIHKIQKCSCTFCRECLKQYITTEIMSQKLEIACPDPLCHEKGRIQLHEIKMLVPWKTFEKYEEFKRNPTRCPAPNCNTICSKSKKFYFGNPNFICCPTCQTPFCFGCSGNWHPNSTCSVDVVPETCRRVRLLKHGSDKPFGFYIRDGTSVRVTPAGLEKVPGIFISRLLAGGLAEFTGLLAVNDEVLEVNGIEVAGKSLGQVTDMMVANSSNLIIIVKPANQRTIMNLAPRRGSFSRNSNMSHGSMLSRSSTQSNTNDSSTENFHEDEEDEIRDLTGQVSNHQQESLDNRGSFGAKLSSSHKKPVLHL